MYSKFVLLFTFLIWSATTLPIPQEASAQTALTRAVIQNLRNVVRLIPQNRTQRPARVSDAMKPGDALSTGQASLAELRFNDGSLARVGEQAVFRFVAKTRNFRLSNGTVLLLIPPGQGRTNVRTPNAAAAIRGSALFVRYNPETDTTVVGALTNSNIEVFNEGETQSQVLRAGQLAVMVKDEIRLFEFDLKTFYETSDLVRGLNLTRENGASSDPAIAAVQEETSTAAAAQSPVSGNGVVENPGFIQSAANRSDAQKANGLVDDGAETRSPVSQRQTQSQLGGQNNSPIQAISSPSTLGEPLKTDPLLNRGQIPSTPSISSTQPSDSALPATQFPPRNPDVQPIAPLPGVQPPVRDPDVQLPAPTPVVTLPITDPVITPPVTDPVITPPVTDPVITPPVTDPVITPPVTAPVITPPVTAPVDTPPVTAPVDTPPVRDPDIQLPVTAPVAPQPEPEPQPVPEPEPQPVPEPEPQPVPEPEPQPVPEPQPPIRDPDIQ